MELKATSQTIKGKTALDSFLRIHSMELKEVGGAGTAEVPIVVAGIHSMELKGNGWADGNGYTNTKESIQWN